MSSHLDRFVDGLEQNLTQINVDCVEEVSWWSRRASSEGGRHAKSNRCRVRCHRRGWRCHRRGWLWFFDHRAAISKPWFGPLEPLLRDGSLAAGETGGMMGQGMRGSMPRHDAAMMSGIPAPYGALRNPLPRTRESVERGEVMYDNNCASRHGRTARATGRQPAALIHPRATWLARTDADSSRDPFTYWTIAEGGSQFGSAMPDSRTRY